MLRLSVFLVLIMFLSSCAQIKTGKYIPALPKKVTTEQHPKKSLMAKSKKSRIKGILQAHNVVREKVGVPKLHWSKNLADYARQWANILAEKNSCRMQHRPPGSPYGENLYWASPIRWSNGKRELQQIRARHVVEEWANEADSYDYQGNTCRAGQTCGHYTQLIWKNSLQLGCAMAICRDKSQVWVCNYDPPGNFLGKLPY